MWLQKNKEELKKLKTWDETPIHVIPNVMVIQVLQCKLSPSSYIVGKWVVMTCVTSARYSRHTHTKSRDRGFLEDRLRQRHSHSWAGAVKAKQCSVSSQCKLCQDPVEDLTHILCHCPSFSESRQRILSELAHLLSETSYEQSSKILAGETVDILFSEERSFTQFILDIYRYSTGDPKVSKIFALCRDLCFTIHTTRIKLLRKLKNQTK